MKKIIFTILFLLIYSVCFGTTYYIDATNGNNSNDGLSGDDEGGGVGPWQTLAKATSLPSGDDVYLLCGETWSSESLTINWSGTSGNYVVIGAYYMDGGVETVGVNGDGKPIIDGETTYPIVNTNPLVKASPNFQYITIQDLHIKRSNGFGIQTGKPGSYITIQRCKIDTTYRANIYFSWTVTYPTVQYCELIDGASGRLPTDSSWDNGGISFRGTSYATAKYNYIYNQHGEGIDLGYYSTIMYNTLADLMSVGIYMNGSHHCEVAYNMIVGTDDTTYDNPKVEGNWNGFGITIANEETSSYHNCTDNKIHHNIVINTYAGIRMYNPHTTYYVDYIYIYNNTFIDNKNSFYISNQGDRVDHNVYVKNNISYPKHADSGHVTTSDSSIDNWDVDYQDWSIDSAPTDIWAGAHDQTGDPTFPKSTWRDSLANMASFATSDTFHTGASTIDTGVNLGAAIKYSITTGTDFHTSDPDNDPIEVNLKEQEDPWNLGHFIPGFNIYDQFPTASHTCTDITDPYEDSQTVQIGVTSSANATCKYDLASTDPCSSATYAGLATTFDNTTGQTSHTDNQITQTCGDCTDYSVICQNDSTGESSQCRTISVCVSPGGGVVPQVDYNIAFDANGLTISECPAGQSCVSISGVN